MDIAWEDKENNLKKAEMLVCQAAREGARLIIFPEMSFTGFSMNVDRIGEWADEGRGHSHSTLETLKNWSLRYHIAIAFGYVTKERMSSGRIVGRNIAAVVSEGQVLLQYEKLHPFGYAQETLYYRAGERLALCEIDQIPFSFFICYDLRFPEIFQLVSNRAKVLTVIANWPKNRLNHWELLLRARAVENQAFCIGVNRTGSGGGLEYARSSMAFDPSGERLPEVACKEELCMIDIDPMLVDLVRQDFPLKMDRRDEFYGTLYQSLLNK
jgi:predicted amidohydrolase